jgi:predicted PurR-regulated permease PerM
MMTIVYGIILILAVLIAILTFLLIKMVYDLMNQQEKYNKAYENKLAELEDKIQTSIRFHDDINKQLLEILARLSELPAPKTKPKAKPEPEPKAAPRKRVAKKP